MKTFTNANPRDLAQVSSLIQKARADGHTVAIAGGGTDLLGMIKERLVAPDVLVNLKAIPKLDQVAPAGNGDLHIGGLTTLDALSRHATVRRSYTVLAEAAESVATPQIRNFGTLAGNVCQRPWCWYFRNGFKCFKAGGNQCFSATGENQFHAIFGGGPSFIVHPSDTAPALVALDAKFRVVGASGERTLEAADFFVLPKQNAARENVLAEDEVLAGIELPSPRPGTRSTYHKILDREAWTHAVVSAAVVLEMDNNSVCRSARIVLGGVAPIPWRVPEAERLLVGQRVTPELAAKVGETAIAGANPLRKNGYKLPLTKAVVQRTLVELAARA
jgi:xanthine dehydrogenase YagS FAD-binding subunit